MSGLGGLGNGFGHPQVLQAVADADDGLGLAAAAALAADLGAELFEVRIALDDWPAVEGAPTPLPITVSFRHDNGSVGDVRIVAGMPATAPLVIEIPDAPAGADGARCAVWRDPTWVVETEAGFGTPGVVSGGVMECRSTHLSTFAVVPGGAAALGATTRGITGAGGRGLRRRCRRWGRG